MQDIWDFFCGKEYWIDTMSYMICVEFYAVTPLEVK